MSFVECCSVRVAKCQTEPLLMCCFIFFPIFSLLYLLCIEEFIFDNKKCCLFLCVTSYSFHLVVFMGSLKYPDENGFDAFLKKHGGSDNASTDCERTVFQFDVQRKYFKEALDR